MITSERIYKKVIEIHILRYYKNIFPTIKSMEEINTDNMGRFEVTFDEYSYSSTLTFTVSKDEYITELIEDYVTL